MEDYAHREPTAVQVVDAAGSTSATAPSSTVAALKMGPHANTMDRWASAVLAFVLKVSDSQLESVNESNTHRHLKLKCRT
jgi:hypothetical protein